VTAGLDGNPLRIFWQRYQGLLDVMAQERRFATHRELGEMLRLRRAARDYWDMHPEASEWSEWVPSETALGNELGRVPDRPSELVIKLRLGGSEPVPAEEEEAVSEPKPAHAADGVDGRFDRWRIPLPSFWYVLEQRVKNGKLAKVNALSEQTRRNSQLQFVGRTRVGGLVDWIDEHPEQARRALELHETPAGFRATPEGVLVPRPGRAASRRGSR
jgi:hypothetical protein